LINLCGNNQYRADNDDHIKRCNHEMRCSISRFDLSRA
jgi:hypothetical protein